MNVAYPAAEFETDAATIDGLANLLRTGFENPEGIRGTVKVSVPEHPGRDFVARFGDELLIERDDLERKTDTQVTIRIATIRRIFSEFEFLDWRDPEIIGTITFEGNLGYANHLAKCCLRPSDWTMARFRRATRLHAARGYRDLTDIERLHQPTQRQILEAMEESRPVVITGLEPTPPCRDWTIDRLAERFGEAVVRV
ncbi:MAG: hypothetical protein F4186_06590, partial [Boseongicola sp. SB0676_bin_33]|nr:hypothetical protein [Boseongicola sp. SB0676_bin_33]